MSVARGAGCAAATTPSAARFAATVSAQPAASRARFARSSSGPGSGGGGSDDDDGRTTPMREWLKEAACRKTAAAGERRTAKIAQPMTTRGTV
jgi:hypothetical protein